MTENAGAERADLHVHDLRPAPGARTAKRRVGRGEAGKRGKTAGRGTKGTKARGQVPRWFEGGQMPLHMRVPKRKGFTSPNRVERQAVNVGDLARLFPDGGAVGPTQMAAAGAVRPRRPVAVLGTGELSVALDVTAHHVSASARQKIEAAGGSVTTTG